MQAFQLINAADQRLSTDKQANFSMMNKRGGKRISISLYEQNKSRTRMKNYPKFITESRIDQLKMMFLTGGYDFS